MKALRITVRRIGNSLGVVIPKPLLAQFGLVGQAEMTVERDAIVLRRPRKSVRSGWAEAAQAVAARGDDHLLMGEFRNSGDSGLAW
jgi:antitoxin MazE